MEEEYDSEAPEEDVNMDLVKQVAELSSENQRLADICEERDYQIAVLSGMLHREQASCVIYASAYRA